MRGVTFWSSAVEFSLVISTHTPHARRDGAVNRVIDIECISTHTPHARRDEPDG